MGQLCKTWLITNLKSCQSCILRSVLENFGKLKQTKSENPSKHDAISLKDFEKYFTDKFKSCSVGKSDYLCQPRELVQEKYDEIQGKPKDYTTSVSVFKMRKYVKQLKNGCAPGVDGIVTEHLKFSLDSDMPL